MTTLLDTSIHICITRPDQERYISEELANRAPHASSSVLAPQVVSIPSVHDAEIFAIPLCFAQQILPNVSTIEAPSISGWAKAIVTHLCEHEHILNNGWLLHVFDPESSLTGVQYGRAKLIEESLLELLKKKRRSLLRSLHQSDVDDKSQGSEDRTTENKTLVQVLCLDQTSGFMSITPSIERTHYHQGVSTYFGGHVTIEDDKRPPSRAFKKLQEAIRVFGLSMKPGDTAVDLGASPGGWTYVLQSYGLAVTALDRSPLDPSLMNHRSITWLRGNALTWKPAQPVTWLVCDVITTPKNTLSILKSWLEDSWCKNFCVTVKCQGDPEFDTIHEILTFVADHTRWFGAKQLTNNKNEFTICGELAH